MSRMNFGYVVDVPLSGNAILEDPSLTNGQNNVFVSVQSENSSNTGNDNFLLMDGEFFLTMTSGNLLLMD
jgi:hypothetical protein